MKQYDPSFFHKLYGLRRPRAVYYKRDFVDYVLMIALCALVIDLSYGLQNVISILGFALCAFELAMFVKRHGIKITVPLILKSPHEVLYLVVYKLQNLKTVYFIALGLLLLENVAIAATPELPHHLQLM